MIRKYFSCKYFNNGINPSIQKGSGNCLITNYRSIFIVSFILLFNRSKNVWKYSYKRIITLIQKYNYLTNRVVSFPVGLPLQNLLILQNYVFKNAFIWIVRLMSLKRIYFRRLISHTTTFTRPNYVCFCFRNLFYLSQDSFISGKKQYVKFKNFESAKYDASSGIPQGSRLALFLFSIHVNDVKIINSLFYLLLIIWKCS